MMRILQAILFMLFAGGSIVAGARAQPGAITGTVVDAETGTPIVDVNVVVRGEEGRFGTSTDDAGRYHFTNLPPGVYTVQATAIGYLPAERRIQVDAEETQTIPIALEAQAYELNEIVVQGQEAQEATPSTVQRISGADIVRQDPASVAEVGRLIPSAHVQTNSRGQTLLYLRGTGERQVAQFFDGALLNVPWDNRVDIGVLPAAMLEGITVSKGVPSVRYGTNVIGGAVNFQSRSLDESGQLTEMSGIIGTAGARRASLTHMGRHGAFSYTSAFEVAQRSGFALPDGAEVPFSQEGRSLRTNTDRRLVNGFLRGTYQLSGGIRIGGSVFHVDAEKGVAPESHIDPAVQPDKVRYWRYPVWRKSMLILNGEVPFEGESTLRGAVWSSRFEQEIFQYQSVAYEQLRETQNDRDLTGGARLIWEQPLGNGTLNAALNALTTRHRQVNVTHSDGQPASDSVTTYRQHLVSVGTEYEVPLTERLEGLIGVSVDGSVSANIGPWAAVDTLNLTNGNASTTVSLTAGLTYRLTDHLSWTAALGRKPRFPTMRERFSGALGAFLPNPDLKPVTAYLAESGLVWEGVQASGEVTAFLNRTVDAIDKTTLPSGIEQRINLDGSRVYGIELVGTVVPTDRLSIDGHLTWMRPRGERGGEWGKLDEKPAWLSTITATYDLPFKLTVVGQSEYMAGAYARCGSVSARCAADEINTFVRLPRALIFNARLSRDFLASDQQLLAGEVFLRVDNVTDALRLLQLGLPGAGREIEGGVKFTF